MARLNVRTRVGLIILVAIGVIFFPYGILHTFEGMENEWNGLTVVEHPHDSPTEVPAVGALPGITHASQESSAASWTLPPISRPHPPRPDLPERKLTSYVDPLIGTEGPGHCITHPPSCLIVAYAGATIPFGMAKPVADSIRPWQNQAGFLHDEIRIKGISQLHDEGTGGDSSLGNFPIWMNKCAGQSWLLCPTTREERMGTRVGEPISQVGSFSIPIDTGFVIGMVVFWVYD